MKLRTLLERTRSLLLGPLAPLPYVRIEGCQVIGQERAPVLKLYIWVETPRSDPVIRELRVELTEPQKDNAHLGVRSRRHEDVALALPLDTGGISPRLTVLAHLTQPLPGPGGEVTGRVAALARPGAVVRWTRFQCAYRWGVQSVAEPAEAVPEGEETAPQVQAAATSGEDEHPGVS